MKGASGSEKFRFTLFFTGLKGRNCLPFLSFIFGCCQKIQPGSVMRLRFDDITPQPRSYSFSEEELVGFSEFNVAATADVAVSRSDSGNVLLRGILVGSLSTNCDRCCAPLVVFVETEFEYTIVVGEEDIAGVVDMECRKEDIYTLYVTEPVIDVFEILREQLYLAAPLKVLCDESCQGVCFRCGVDLNLNSCSCYEKASDSPFAVLGKLKKIK